MASDKGALADDDDPVIAEIDTYISTELINNFTIRFVVQYPLRPTYRPLKNPSAAKVKPESEILKFYYDIDSNEEHYDPEAEDYLKLSKKPMISTAIPPSTNYAVGVFRDGQFHLTSVRRIHQMKPCLEYIDDASNDPSIIDLDEMEEDEKAVLKPLQVQYARKGGRGSQQKYLHAVKKQMEMSEAWIDLNMHPIDSVYVAEEFERLFCEASDQTPFDISCREYLEMLKHSEERASK